MKQFLIVFSIFTVATLFVLALFIAAILNLVKGAISETQETHVRTVRLDNGTVCKETVYLDNGTVCWL
jgi:hypothetical protein